MKQKFEEQLENILTVAKSFFLLEFQEILLETSESEIEQKLASSPGLLVSIFTHITE